MIDDEDRIRRKAYELWVEEGRPHGRSEEHWQEAARLVAAENGQGSGRGGRRKAAGDSAPPVASPDAHAREASPGPKSRRGKAASAEPAPPVASPQAHAAEGADGAGKARRAGPDGEKLPPPARRSKAEAAGRAPAGSTGRRRPPSARSGG